MRKKTMMDPLGPARLALHYTLLHTMNFLKFICLFVLYCLPIMCDCHYYTYTDINIQMNEFST